MKNKLFALIVTFFMVISPQLALAAEGTDKDKE